MPAVCLWATASDPHVSVLHDHYYQAQVEVRSQYDTTGRFFLATLTRQTYLANLVVCKVIKARDFHQLIFQGMWSRRKADTSHPWKDAPGTLAGFGWQERYGFESCHVQSFCCYCVTDQRDGNKPFGCMLVSMYERRPCMLFIQRQQCNASARTSSKP